MLLHKHVMNYSSCFNNTQAHFTLGVKANAQLKSSIPIGANVEISPKGSNLGSQFANLGANVAAFINIVTSKFQHLLVTWGQTTSQKCSMLAPQVFPALTPSVKRALINPSSSPCLGHRGDEISKHRMRFFFKSTLGFNGGMKLSLAPNLVLNGVFPCPLLS